MPSAASSPTTASTSLVCDRIVFMHQGRVHEIGPPEEVFARPRTPELQQFLGMVQ